MIAAGFYFVDFTDDLVYSGKIGHLWLWYSLGQAFAFDQMFIINQTSMDIDFGRPVPFFEEYKQLSELLTDYSNLQKIVFSPYGFCPCDCWKNCKPIKLQDFEHPKNDVLYLFGRDVGDFDTCLKDCEWVEIATPRNKTLYSLHAASIVFWDRFIKNGS